MSDIAQHLPKQSKTVAALFDYHKKRGDSEPQRGYLGASIIGHSCERYLWYCFRQCVKRDFSGRLYRLFETGDLEEARFVQELRAIGCTVHDVDPNTGEQFGVMTLGGHFLGHMDGYALGIPEAPKTWHVLEFKTHNDKSFAKLTKEGVQTSKPQHYAQMQVYMHLTGMKRALYLARNKNDDDLYSERVRYDGLFAKSLMQRAERIINATQPPERIANRPDYYECQWCDAHDICWGVEDQAVPLPTISCRQCCHATPKMDGQARWVCEKHKRSLSSTDQDKACDDHLLLPGLVTFAEPVDYSRPGDGGEFIEFEGEGGFRWKHSQQEGAYSTEELTKLSRSDLRNPMIAGVKDWFGATVVNVSDDLQARYPREDSRIVWKGRATELCDAWQAAYHERLEDLTPLTTTQAPDCRGAEYVGGRVALVFPPTGKAEIRKGKE